MSDLENLLAQHLHLAGIVGWEREYRFAPPRRWRFDFAFIDRKLAVEVDGATWSGGRHARGSGIERDAEKYSWAAALGWRVLRVTRKMVESGEARRLVEQALATEVAR